VFVGFCNTAQRVPSKSASLRLESILCAQELRQRPARRPDFDKENRTLVAVARALVDSRANILEISETILDVTQCALCMHYINGWRRS
jgi:hypothetical protein